jgi:hypothetical protein
MKRIQPMKHSNNFHSSLCKGETFFAPSTLRHLCKIRSICVVRVLLKNGTPMKRIQLIDTETTFTPRSVRAKHFSPLHTPTSVQNPFNLCRPCSLEEWNTDETDSTDRHRNDFHSPLCKGETFFAPPHSDICAKSVQSVSSAFQLRVSHLTFNYKTIRVSLFLVDSRPSHWLCSQNFLLSTAKIADFLCNC